MNRKMPGIVRLAGVFTREECEALGQRILRRISAPASQIQIQSAARASLEFARGDVHVASESVSTSVTLTVEDQGRCSRAFTNRLDEVALTDLVREAEALIHNTAEHIRDTGHHPVIEGQHFLPPQPYPKGPPLFFEAGIRAMEPEAQGTLFRRATDAAEAAGLIAAGNLNLLTEARWAQNTAGLRVYDPSTYGEFSLTARTKDGTGSGWGWSGFEDWARVDIDGVIARAIDLAQRSAEPVAVEPGRYTVILEPPAIAALLQPINWSGTRAEAGATAFSKDPLGSTKIDLQMIDRRLNMVASPWDPDMPHSTVSWETNLTPIPVPITLFKAGVLKNLFYSHEDVRGRNRPAVVFPFAVRFTADGSPTSLEDMIASTKRGLWVNRLSNVGLMDDRTLLLTGTTRDGTFLIENGKITKPIKNFRFTESPFFVLNKLDAWGTPVRAARNMVAPRVKVWDFNFTSLTDAV